MGLFKKAEKVFYSVILKSDSCKFLFREIDSKRRVKSQMYEREQYESEEDLREKFAAFLERNDNKPGVTSILINDIEQNYITDMSEFEGDESEFVFENVAKDFIVYYPKSCVQAKNDAFGREFDSYISALKMLYYLHKNENCSDFLNLFVIKFSTLAVFMFADKNGVKFAKLWQIPPLSTDDDELQFCDKLLAEVKLYYAMSEGSECIDSIYIYHDNILSNESSYVFFTKLYITINTVNLDIIDFMNKMSIKENF